MQPTVTQRAATEADCELIYQILRDAIRPYVEQVWGPWDETDQRGRFASTTILEHHSIIELNGQAIGFTCIVQSPEEIYLDRIMIRPEFQRRGVGEQTLRGLTQRADALGLAMRLRVMKINPARRLYERCGFTIVGEDQTHYNMIRLAARAGEPRATRHHGDV